MTTQHELLKELRELTGAGVVDIRRAIDAANGDREQALELLRKEGKKVAEKKAARSANEGYIGSYIHSNGKIAAMVGLACETDFVARNTDFQTLAKDIAMHIAAMNPQYVTREEVPESVIAKEQEIYREQIAQENKPEAVVEKIIAGKIEKFYSEHCLLDQPFVKDDKMTVSELIHEAVAKLGEKIEVRHVTRFQL